MDAKQAILGLPFDDDGSRPPGCCSQILRSPSGLEKVIEVAVLQEHRFAFYYWQKWRNASPGRSKPATLVSLDWHEDLSVPSDRQKQELLNLDTSDFSAVALHCWQNLSPMNDGQILAAAYLNLIGDICVLRKQPSRALKEFESHDGQLHVIRSFDRLESLLECLPNEKRDTVYFDVDLDFFTESSEPCGGGNVTLATEQEVRAYLGPEAELMAWILPRMSGFTIATEPEYCGGLRRSGELFSMVDFAMFEGGLLTKQCKWKHL